MAVDQGTPRHGPPVVVDRALADAMAGARGRATLHCWLGLLAGLASLAMPTLVDLSDPRASLAFGKWIGLSGVLLFRGLAHLERIRKTEQLLAGFRWWRWSGRFTQVGRGGVTLVLWPVGTPEPGTPGAWAGAEVVVRARVVLGSVDSGLLRGSWLVDVAGDPRRLAVVHVPGTPLVTLASAAEGAP